MKSFGFWVWGCICAFALCIVLAMGLVWVNIEGVDISYKLTSLNTELDNQKELRDKLEVERNSLLGSYLLTSKAKEFDLHPPKPGQIRKLSDK